MPIDSATLTHLFPELLLVFFAVCLLVGGTWNPTKIGWSTLAVIAFGFAGLLLVQHAGSRELMAGRGEAVLADPLSSGLRGLALLLGALFAVFSTQSRQQRLYPELLGLIVLMLVGLMLVCSAGDLVLLFLGLELISIPTYALLFIGRDSRQSDEATAKYFFLSILSSAMMLYGFATLYGLAGDTRLDAIQAVLRGPDGSLFPAMYPLAVGLILVGFCFKIAAVPFHFYAPDVYQSSTNLNAAILAVVPKIAGVVGMVRILVVALPHDSAFAWKLVLVLSVLSMTLGNVAALWQENMRRLMAYSSIAHAGYLMLGLAAALGATPGIDFGRDAVAAMLFYVSVYAVASVGVFAAVAYLGDDETSFSTLTQLSGVGRKYPVIGAVIAIAMFSLAGIPPLAGFWGKFSLFRTAVEAGIAPDGTLNYWFLGLCAAGGLNAAIAAGYYLRVVGALYFRAPEQEPTTLPVVGNAGAGLAALVCALVLVGVGLFTDGGMTAAQSAADRVWPVDAVKSQSFSWMEPLRAVELTRVRMTGDSVRASRVAVDAATTPARP